MSTVLDHAREDRQQRFGEKLDQFRKQTVTQENYDQFNDELQNTIEQVDEIILALQDDREELKAKKGEFKDRYGEKELQLLREEDADHIKLGETGWEGDLRQLNRRLEDWSDYRAELQRIGRLKLRQVLDQLDAQSIKMQAYEKMDEITEKRWNDLDDQMNRLEAELRDEIMQVKDDAEQKRREDREALRDELNRHWELVKDVIEPMLGVLDRLGADVEAVRKSLDERAAADLPHMTSPDATASAASTDGTDESMEARYQFKDCAVGACQEELRRMVDEEDVAEMSREEIVALTDVEYEEFFDEEDGILHRVEDAFGDSFPEVWEEG